jgi:hypothetical protein
MPLVTVAAVATPSPTARPSSEARADAPSGSIERADALAVRSLEAFDRSGGLADARRALEAARRAREDLETRRGSERDADTRREELIFLNHVVLGFSAYLAEPGREGAREKLASILRRGRAHRDRARQPRRDGRS